MYLIINSNTQQVVKSIDVKEVLPVGMTRYAIDDEEFSEDMVGSLFFSVENYIPRPSPHHVIQGSPLQWVDSRNEEERWTALREERNNCLSKCDWTQLLDCPLTTDAKNAYATWRQQFRDLPQDYPNIDDAEAALEDLRNNPPSGSPIA